MFVFMDLSYLSLDDFFLVASICIEISCHCFWQLSNTHCVMYLIFITHSMLEGQVGSFQLLGISSKAAINIIEKESLWYDWAYFEHRTKSEIVVSLRYIDSQFSEKLPAVLISKLSV